MHIPDGWIDVPTSAAGAVVAGGAVAVAVRRAAVAFKQQVTTLPAVVAAYLLIAQLLVLPVGFGTGAHMVGTGLAALLVGPSVAIVCVAVVVVVQALLLADGGVTAIGLNIINDGLVPALVAWGVLRLLHPRVRLPLVAGFAGGLSSLSAGLVAAAMYAVGGNQVVSTEAVTTTVGLAHLGVAIAEGCITAATVSALTRLRPGLLLAGRPGPTGVPAIVHARPQPAGQHGDNDRAGLA